MYFEDFSCLTQAKAHLAHTLKHLLSISLCLAQQVIGERRWSCVESSQEPQRGAEDSGSTSPSFTEVAMSVRV